MPGPAQPATSTVGALLRLIEQEKSKAPHLQVAAASPSAPVREAAQAPLEAPIQPESPGTARTVGVRPEAATAEATQAVTASPGRTKFGGIGGPGEGVSEIQAEFEANLPEGVRVEAPGVYSYPEGYTPPAPKPKRQPTLAEYRAQGKTADQWYAETGQQSSLDALRKDPRTHIDSISGEISHVGEERHPSHLRTIPGYEIDPVSGEVKYTAPGKKPTLDEYLSQGKTAEQWYMETGQQFKLDEFGGKVPVSEIPQGPRAPQGSGAPLPKPTINPPLNTLAQNLSPSGLPGATTQATGAVGAITSIQTLFDHASDNAKLSQAKMKEAAQRGDAGAEAAWTQEVIKWTERQIEALKMKADTEKSLKASGQPVPTPIPSPNPGQPSSLAGQYLQAR